KVLAKMKDLSMHIIDILQNSIEAGAGEIRLIITEVTAGDRLTLEITDNGRGMDEELMAKVIDPFFTTRTTRRIGLGLPLLKAAAERCEGQMTISSAPGKGTSVTAEFRHSHIDRAPLGNIIDTVVNVIVGHPDLNLYFSHHIDGKDITLDAKELREQLEDVPLNNPAVINWIKKYLTDSYNEIRGNA
ncbi:MAG: ATP-binding protein, partial [Eubacteriales bacterium]